MVAIQERKPRFTKKDQTPKKRPPKNDAASMLMSKMHELSMSLSTP
jgi:hypothetical protein